MSTVVGMNQTSPFLPRRSNLHLDILLGKDESIEVEDVLTGEGELNWVVDRREEMERRVRI
jgi:hypothetical protein